MKFKQNSNEDNYVQLPKTLSSRERNNLFFRSFTHVQKLPNS